MSLNPPNQRPARTPEEYLDRIELRTRRRIGGGLLTLHERGTAQLGSIWNIALAACGVAGVILGSTWLRRPRTTVSFGRSTSTRLATFLALRSAFFRQ